VDYELKEELINLGWGQDVEMISTTESPSGLVSPNTIEYCNILCNTNNRDNESVCSHDKLDVLLDHFKLSGEKSAFVFIHRGAPISRFFYDLKSRGIKAVALHENINR